MQSIFGGGGFRPAGTLDDNATLDGGGAWGGFRWLLYSLLQHTLTLRLTTITRTFTKQI